MTIYRVPVFIDVPAYTYTVQFEGETYRFVFTFNSRSQSWYVDIADDNDILIVAGQRLSNDFPLFRTRNQSAPPGMLVCISLEDDNADPDLAALGRRVRFLYFEASELPEAAATVSGLTITPS